MDSASKPPDLSAGIAYVLDIVESVIYLLVAVFLAIMALMTFFIVAQDLTRFITTPGSLDVIDTALNSLLVSLIIAALIQTVIVYIKTHTLDLRLILGVGLTAMIRRILVFGVEKTVTWEQTAVTAALILVIIVGIYLIGERKAQGAGKGQ